MRPALDGLEPSGAPRLFVRVNGMTTGLARDNIAAVICPALFGVYLPKADGPEEVARLDEWLTELEAEAGTAPAPSSSTAAGDERRGHRECYEIAMASPRVAYLGTGGGGQGDMARALGYRETPAGLETLYLRSKVILDVRTAGITNPIGGPLGIGSRIWKGCKRTPSASARWALRARASHPSHVPIINTVFRTPPPRRSRTGGARGLRRRPGQQQGTAAVVYAGRMVDIATHTRARHGGPRGASTGSSRNSRACPPGQPAPRSSTLATDVS